eukprot:3459118-Rhodomonas_salina.1
MAMGWHKSTRCQRTAAHARGERNAHPEVLEHRDHGHCEQRERDVRGPQHDGVGHAEREHFQSERGVPKLGTAEPASVPDTRRQVLLD